MVPLEWLSDLPILSFDEGENIIVEGTQPKRLYFLRNGKVEVESGGLRIAVIKSPGSVLGELSTVLGKPATATVTALEKADFHVADEPLDFLRGNPKIHLQVSRMLAFRLDAATRYLVDVKEQLEGCSDHVGMVDGVLDAIIHRDLKKKLAP